MSTERGFRLPLAARIFFASGIMVAIAVALAALVTLQYGRKAGEDRCLALCGQARHLWRACLFVLAGRAQRQRGEVPAGPG